jgi:hypothetical protein
VVIATPSLAYATKHYYTSRAVILLLFLEKAFCCLLNMSFSSLIHTLERVISHVFNRVVLSFYMAEAAAIASPVFNQSTKRPFSSVLTSYAHFSSFQFSTLVCLGQPGTRANATRLNLTPSIRTRTSQVGVLTDVDSTGSYRWII